MSIGLLSARLRGLLQREDLQRLVLPLAGASGLSLYALVSEGGISFPLFTVVFLCITPHLQHPSPYSRSEGNGRGNYPLDAGARFVGESRKSGTRVPSIVLACVAWRLPSPAGLRTHPP
jgi:hypothetical protein